jgi:hypothetical protein
MTKFKTKFSHPFYDVVVKDHRLLGRAIMEGLVPAGVMQINLAFLREWVHKEYPQHPEQLGLQITPRKIIAVIESSK